MERAGIPGSPGGLRALESRVEQAALLDSRGQCGKERGWKFLNIKEWGQGAGLRSDLVSKNWRIPFGSSEKSALNSVERGPHLAWHQLEFLATGPEISSSLFQRTPKYVLKDIE